MSCYKKVLLTGATGLIGKELIKPLREHGFDIYAITIDDINSDNDVNWIKCNLFDEISVKQVFENIKPEYFLNMAWCTTGDYLSSDKNYDFLEAGINLLKCFKENGGKRAVFAGTCFEYKFKDEPLKETDELEPEKTVYTYCKNKLHEIAQYYCKQNGISFGWGRIFYVFGRDESKTRLTGMVIDKLNNNEKVIIKNSDLLKDYMYTKDIAGAFAKFLDCDIEDTVNICTGKTISVGDYVLKIARYFGKEYLIELKNEKTNQPKIISGDNTKLTKEVGYKIQFSTDKAIEDILKED